MPFLNTVFVLGNLAADPEVHRTSEGKAVCTVSVASNEVWNNRTTGDKQEHTEWHRVVMFGAQAENFGKYARKGNQVHIQGRLRTRSYDQEQQVTVVDVNGNEVAGAVTVKKYVTEIISDRSQILTRNPNQVGGMSKEESESVPQVGDDFLAGSGIPA